MDRTYRRNIWALVPAAISFAIAVVIFWSVYVLFTSDAHITWAIIMIVVAVLVGLPFLLLSLRLLRFKITIRDGVLRAPKIRPLNIKLQIGKDKTVKVSDLSQELLSGSQQAVQFITSIFDNKMFGGRYRREREEIILDEVKSFDIAKIQSSGSRYCFVIFNLKDDTKRVIDIYPLGSKKIDLLVEEMQLYAKEGVVVECPNGKYLAMTDAFLDNLMLAEIAVHGLSGLAEALLRSVPAIIACCCEGLG